MTKQELIAKLEDERAKLEEAISTLTSEQMQVEQAAGEWSVKDVLGHLAAWTSRCVTIVYDAEQGVKPADVDDMLDHWDTLNDEDRQMQHERPLERVVSDFRGAHRQLIKRLSAWKDTGLNDKNQFAWLRGKSLAEFIISEVADHDDEHRDQISRPNNADF